MSDTLQSPAAAADQSNSKALVTALKALLSIYQTGQAGPAQIEALNQSIATLEAQVTADETSAADVNERLTILENAQESMAEQINTFVASQTPPAPAPAPEPVDPPVTTNVVDPAASSTQAQVTGAVVQNDPVVANPAPVTGS